jgi:beta-glucosidase
MNRTILIVTLCLCVAACSDDTPGEDAGAGEDGGGDSADAAGDPVDPGSLRFSEELIFGAASASHQIEGGNTNNNWYQFETLEQYAGVTDAPSGMAANGYELWQTDNGLVEATHLDSYRFSIEWSRVEPSRDTFDDDAIAHYRAILEDLRDRGIRPFVTLHHFTDPIWIWDLADYECESGPSDENLCGWSNPDTIAEFVEYAERMAEEYGDLVDHWSTYNEPNTVSHVGYLAGVFPPGNPGSSAPAIPRDDRWIEVVVPFIRSTIEAHASAYDAIHAADTSDADGDGVAAVVGWTVAAQYILPADPENEAYVEAAERYRTFLNFMFPDSIATGNWDPDFDGEIDEVHPEWVGRQDFIGVQYYARVFVLDSPFGDQIMNFAPCFGPIAALLSDCPQIDPNNLSFVNEVYPEGLYEVVSQFAERYPGMDLPITENGAAALNGERKAQILVRHLEQLHRLLDDGFPVTAYYAWSLTDNFEWADGFEPRFGIYTVDYDTFERTATRAQQVLSEVARTRILSSALLGELGEGPLFADE